jgi:hypothetical protein
MNVPLAGDWAQLVREEVVEQAESELMTDFANSWRWWIRLSIKPSLRVWKTGVLVVDCVLGWIVHLAKVQRDAVSVIKKIGGSVQYEWQFKEGRMVTNGEPRGGKWLSRFFGGRLPRYRHKCLDPQKGHRSRDGPDC